MSSNAGAITVASTGAESTPIAAIVRTIVFILVTINPPSNREEKSGLQASCLRQKSTSCPRGLRTLSPSERQTLSKKDSRPSFQEVSPRNPSRTARGISLNHACECVILSSPLLSWNHRAPNSQFVRQKYKFNLCLKDNKNFTPVKWFFRISRKYHMQAWANEFLENETTVASIQSTNEQCDTPWMPTEGQGCCRAKDCAKRGSSGDSSSRLATKFQVFRQSLDPGCRMSDKVSILFSRWGSPRRDIPNN